MSGLETGLTGNPAIKKLLGLESKENNGEQDLRDAAKVNQQIEEEQAQHVSEMKNNQEQAEQTLQSSVYFPQDIAFEQKMRNAKGYVRTLFARKKLQRMQKRTIRCSLGALLQMEGQEKPTVSKAQMAQDYWKRSILLGHIR